jgi:hypothetical protein
MNTVIRRLTGGVVAALILAGTGAGSRIPTEFAAADSGLVRLAWRTLGERVRTCRQLTPEELRRIPTHMRRTEECTSLALPYRLTVKLDGREVLNVLVHAAGARQDRPMFVFREFPVASGDLRLSVEYQRAEDPPAGAEAVGETPPRLELDTTLRLHAREIVVVTYDPDWKRLSLQGTESR